MVALDFGRLEEALAMARELGGVAGMFKINTHLFTAAGPEAVSKIGALGPIFLDLKFHDIPNTVAGAVSAACQLPNVSLLNIHTTGGLAMMQAAAQALAKQAPPAASTRLIGVTILTSMDRSALKQVGIGGSPAARVLSLARLAKRAGLHGVVASPQEVRLIRKACGPRFLIVTPGVRPVEKTGKRRADDQARVATPLEAIRAGADYLVVGRPITGAAQPRAAAEAIVSEIEAGLQPV